MAVPWLAHHEPADFHRCVRIGPWHVCRRCLLLWPVAWLSFGLQAALRLPPDHLADALLPLLLLPPVVEYVGVHLGRWPYRPARVLVLTPLAGVAVGRLVFRLLHAPLDPYAGGLVLVSAAATLYAATRYHQDRQPSPDEALDALVASLPPPPGAHDVRP